MSVGSFFQNLVHYMQFTAIILCKNVIKKNEEDKEATWETLKKLLGGQRFCEL